MIHRQIRKKESLQEKKLSQSAKQANPVPEDKEASTSEEKDKTSISNAFSRLNGGD